MPHASKQLAVFDYLLINFQPRCDHRGSDLPLASVAELFLVNSLNR